jgi:hypothetical protein
MTGDFYDAVDKSRETIDHREEAQVESTNTPTPPMPPTVHDTVHDKALLRRQISQAMHNNDAQLAAESRHTSQCSIADMDLDDTDSLKSVTNLSGVIFPTQKELNIYILRIHLIGFALWQTFLCFDCTARDIDIAFIAGLITGWFVKYARQPNISCVRLATAFVVAGVMNVVVLTEEPDVLDEIHNPTRPSSHFWMRL